MSPAARHVAFLRAINVGGRTITMERLRELFAELPVRDVETFIASGNVVFSSGAKDLAALEGKIERRLQDATGWKVDTFVRSGAEVAALADAAHFPAAADDHSVIVGFLHDAPPAAARAKLAALADARNTLLVHGRELWWWTKGRMSDSGIKNGAFERALGVPTTMRNVTTIRRLAAKLTDG